MVDCRFEISLEGIRVFYQRPIWFESMGQPRLLIALMIDALGSGLFVPISLLFFVATTPLALPKVGLALSVAAVVRIPATILAGPITDRAGARRTVVASQLLQAVGFGSYVFVESFWSLVLTAGLVQVGNSLFWVAYQSLASEAAPSHSQEYWFAMCSAMRTAGTALGGIGAGVAISIGGHGGYSFIAVINAISFAVAALLIGRSARDKRLPNPTRKVAEPSWTTVDGWRSVLADGPFLEFVVLNFGFTLLSLAFALATPVYLVQTVGLPIWTPGVVLALNAVLGTAGVPSVVKRISGRVRLRVLTVSQAMLGIGFAFFLATDYSPLVAGLALALVGVILVAGCEIIQGSVVPAIVIDAAPPRNVGRYMSAYQLTFAVGDMIAPTLVTRALAHGAVTLWVPMIAIAGLGIFLIALIARRMPALRRTIGSSPPASSVDYEEP